LSIGDWTTGGYPRTRYRCSLGLFILEEQNHAYNQPFDDASFCFRPLPMPFPRRKGPLRRFQLADATRAAPAVQSAPATAAPAEKPICKLLPSSYSHSSKRVCLTKEQWKQVDEQMRD
jgi:hypothetical protein